MSSAKYSDPRFLTSDHSNQGGYAPQQITARAAGEAVFDLNGRVITGGPETGLDDDATALTSVGWVNAKIAALTSITATLREVILSNSQLDDNEGVLPAFGLYFDGQPTAGSVISLLSDTLSVEAFTEGVDWSLGGTPALSMTALAAAITAGTSFKAKFCAGLSQFYADGMIVVSPKTQVGTSDNLRAFASVATNIGVVSFNASTAAGAVDDEVAGDYGQSNVRGDFAIPTSDQGVSYSGFLRAKADLREPESHACINENEWKMWEHEDQLWQIVSSTTGVATNGVPSGGATGAVPHKASVTDYDLSWAPGVRITGSGTQLQAEGLTVKTGGFGTTFTSTSNTEDYDLNMPSAAPVASFAFLSVNAAGQLSFSSTAAASTISVDNSAFDVLMATGLQNAINEIDQTFLSTASTGVRYGGDLTDLGSGVVRIALGVGGILNNTTPATPTYTAVAWPQTDLDLSAADGVYYIYVNSSGTVQSTTSEPDSSDHRLNLWLWRVSIRSGVVSGTSSIVQPIQQYTADIRDLFNAIGIVKSGLTLYPAGLMTIGANAGRVFDPGANFFNDPTSPHILNVSAASPLTFRMVDRNGNQSADLTNLPVTNWDNAGTIEAISGAGSRATIIECRLFPGSQNYRFFYGQTVYNTVNDAQLALREGLYVPVVPSTYDNAVIIGYIIVQKGATNLADGVQRFITTNKFGLIGGAISSSGIGQLLAVNNLSDLTDPAAALVNLGLTATATELNHVDGVTSSIQDQINALSGGVKASCTVSHTTVPPRASTNTNVFVFNTTPENEGGFTVTHSATLGTSIQVPKTARYLITFNVTMGTGHAGYIHTGVSVNNNTNNSGGTLKAAIGFQSASGCAVVNLTAGDLVWFSGQGNGSGLWGNGYANATVTEL